MECANGGAVLSLDLVTTLQELTDLNIGFISLNEALDLTTSTGWAMAGMLSVFAAFEPDILRDRVRAGLDHARQSGTRLGISATAVMKAAKVRKLFPPGNQQIRNLPAAGYRQNLRPSHSSSK